MTQSRSFFSIINDNLLDDITSWSHILTELPDYSYIGSWGCGHFDESTRFFLDLFQSRATGTNDLAIESSVDEMGF